MAPHLLSRCFGCLSTGQPVEAWTLQGAGGLVLEAITYGGIVTRLLAPDREGRLADVVLGFNDLGSYLAGHPYFGAMAGRVAGRITGARFTLDGRRYNLALNDPPNHLHGGLVGLDKRLWIAQPVGRPDGAPSLCLTYRSPDGEEGYPGNVGVAVTYTVTADNAFLIETEAASDRPSLFSLTHHSYFNLAGEAAGSIANHELQIHADESIPTDQHMTLLGRRESVISQGNDFRKPRRLGEAIPLLFQRHGDLYFLPRRDPSQKAPRLAARVFDPVSSRVLTVSTTEDYLQFYTGVSLDGSLIGKSGRPYGPHAGLCLECEGYPDGANTPELGDIILRPGQPLHQTTIYAFSTN